MYEYRSSSPVSMPDSAMDEYQEVSGPARRPVSEDISMMDASMADAYDKPSDFKGKKKRG